MSSNYMYLAIDFGSLLVPFIFSFHPKLLFYKKWAALALSNLIVCVLFISWDMLYTHLGVWGFNSHYLTGIYLGNLPVEEILFFICIPYSSIYTYHCLKLFYPDRTHIPYKKITLVISVILFCIGIVCISKIYTSASFILLAITLMLLTYLFKVSWMSNFYFTYVIILIPFFIVNGILTGTGLEKPIVWYNDTQNLGIRLSTIPVEDIFYGMMLLVLNTAFFEYFDKKINQYKALTI